VGSFPAIREGERDSEESNGVIKLQRLLRHHGFEVTPDHVFGVPPSRYQGQGPSPRDACNYGIGLGISGPHRWPHFNGTLRDGW